MGSAGTLFRVSQGQDQGLGWAGLLCGGPGEEFSDLQLWNRDARSLFPGSAASQGFWELPASRLPQAGSEAVDPSCGFDVCDRPSCDPLEAAVCFDGPL